MRPGSPPEPLDRSAMTVAGRSAEVLRQMVLDGRLEPGQRLNEVELAAALRISRGPLREAIQRLASEGLFTTVSHRGAYVRAFDAREISELYEFRIAVESHAVRLAARLANAAGIDDLRSLLDKTGDILRSDNSVSYPQDLDFHLRLVALSANRRLVDASIEINQQLQLARSRSALQPARAREAYEEHEAVLASLAAGDGEQAAALLEAHLRESMTSAVQLLGNPPRTAGAEA